MFRLLTKGAWTTTLSEKTFRRRWPMRIALVAVLMAYLPGTVRPVLAVERPEESWTNLNLLRAQR